MPDKSGQKPLWEGYQPKPTTEPDWLDDAIKKGYQPPTSQQPEGQNPPSGGSNVTPPPQPPKDEKE